eukprot:TRINITY_DN7976_c0_g3_i1.p1 TRINITY_DN7976_c0_g3~~TRINITY_DN7976_c0_g3_i1.p1  ORF type:complete len:133 (-),score=27.31 TRINITY_DN7976_c0_g3_i1:12-362(-)
MFPGELILEDYMHKGVRRRSGVPIQIDVFLPFLRLAFEFHGEQHYNNIPGSGFASLENQRSLDLEKHSLCSAHQIQLIIIPYNWDNSTNHLANLLSHQLSNLSKNSELSHQQTILN